MYWQWYHGSGNLLIVSYLSRYQVTYIVPVIDETSALRTTIDTIFSLVGDTVHEVLIVMAGRTTDNSRRVVRELETKYPKRVKAHQQRLPGVGGAFQEAIALAGGQYVMIMGSDLETDPVFIPRFIEEMQRGNCDIVSGSRWVPGGGFVGYGFGKVMLNRVFQKLVGWLYGTHLTDLTYGYRLYRSEVLENLLWWELKHPFFLECLLKPLRLGARVREVPCQWRPRPEGVAGGSLWLMFCYVPVALRVRLVGTSSFMQPDFSDSVA